MPKQRATKRRTAKGSGLPIASDRTRSRLLEAAGEMFAELGFHHATVRQICDRAGANIASVNYHFGDKTGLYTEVVRQSMRAARFDAVRAVIHEISKPTLAMNQVVAEAIQPVYARLREVISKMLGLPADHEKTRLCAHSIIGQIMFYAFARPVITRLWPEMKMTASQLDRIANHIADFSLAYIRTAGAEHGKGKLPSEARKRR